jgi:hypothetical protein
MVEPPHSCGGKERFSAPGKKRSAEALRKESRLCSMRFSARNYDRSFHQSSGLGTSKYGRAQQRDGFLASRQPGQRQHRDVVLLPEGHGFL